MPASLVTLAYLLWPPRYNSDTPDSSIKSRLDSERGTKGEGRKRLKEQVCPVPHDKYQKYLTPWYLLVECLAYKTG
jgi:hypothetical protein